MVAHLSGLGVPDHHEVVRHPTDDALPVRREGDRVHIDGINHHREQAEMALQRENLKSTPDLEHLTAAFAPQHQSHARFTKRIIHGY